MKIFVTGGTGFIGSHFLNTAHAAGHEVVALRRPGSSSRIPLTFNPTWVDGELNDDFSEVMSKCEVLVHLASHTPNPPYASLQECLRWNVTYSLQLADMAMHAGIRKIIVAGSCFEYGRSAERYENIPVDAPLEPTMSYPTSKAAASIAFLGFAAEHKLQLQLLRIFQVFGEGELSTRLWPSIRLAAQSGKDLEMTPGQQIRDFIDVKDVARQFVQNLNFDNVEVGKPVIKHIGSGKPMSILEFTEIWWKHFGAQGKIIVGALPYRPNEVMRFVPEI